MSQFSFHSPVKAFFGFNAIENLHTLLKPYKRVCVVSGRTSIDKAGFKKYLDMYFKTKEIFYFSEIEENPSINTVIKGGKFAREKKADVVIGFGGGSPLDASKAIAAFATNNKGFYELLSQDELDNEPLPLIAVPATCGTGSEMNNYAIITDTEKMDKVNFAKDNTFPKYAVIDPVFLRSLDKKIIYATAFDALSHGMEGFVSTRANPFSDSMAVTSMEIIMATFADGAIATSDETLLNFLYGSTLAGVTILHTATTLMHALGYWLTNEKGIHHGTANAILMPYYLEMLRLKKVERYDALAAIMQKHSFDIQKWQSELGYDVSLKEIISESEIEAMVDYALEKKNVEYMPFKVDKSFVMDVLVRY
ncbi:iron-containing alcohol dehydrogenase [Denitrovibrio acetiphilus DSM 12809]|uniref:Iron-containing alcohol dehydrogenase n=1 Tax=Denitrovibrio acetiphilus (strain DSM 12809 / NBRC 114555 / N2460) TaxID=522772 RepID=D4H138_DENA2|nr:iron-containing alcohol dehydrogenase family protein [Denitrovibrio acetiphilus]ADD68701.1 iron-containing alcohol dehydrogenase [Denitrovibrio acetiphilus DSM 12809]